MPAMYPAPMESGATNISPPALLRRGLDRAGDEEGIDLLRSGLRQLRAELCDHIAAMEGPDGFYDEVRRSEPRLCCAVSRLRREHGRLRAMVDDLDLWMARDDDDRATLSAARPRIRELLDQWGDHYRRDNRLAYDVWSLDLGGQD